MACIEGGEWRGRRLILPKSATLRPSSSKTKQSIFNMLASLRMKESLEPGFGGLKCLDLYAGIGALGLEALSRGAENCVFIERDPQQLRALKSNMELLGCGDRCRIIAGPVEARLAQAKDFGPFDCIFADPPYVDASLIDRGTEINALLASKGLLLIEHDPKLTEFSLGGLEYLSRRTLGPAGLSLFRKLL